MKAYIYKDGDKWGISTGEFPTVLRRDGTFSGYDYEFVDKKEALEILDKYYTDIRLTEEKDFNWPGADILEVTRI